MFKARHKLKNTKILINEDLTKTQAHIRQEARELKEEKLIQNTWTVKYFSNQKIAAETMLIILN